VLASLVTLLLVGAALASKLAACGGCYNEFMVTDLRTEPATACLALSASTVDVCTADYTVSIRNDCTDPLIVGTRTIGPGTSSSIRGNEVPSDASGRHSLAATLGATSVTISWVLVDTSP